MEVGVLFTNYHAWPLTEYAIKEVLRWSGDKISRILVMDDASDAPAEFPDSTKVVIHRNPKNVGYVCSVNVGMQLMNEDIVLLLDCDAYPLMNLIPGIQRHFETNPQLGALGFFEVGPARKTRIAGEREPTLAHFLAGQKLGSWLMGQGWLLGKRFVVHSCCMAVRRSVFKEIGGFDEKFDFLDADTDFSMRLQDVGWAIAADPSLWCFHQGSGSPQSKSKRVIRFHANRWRLLQKHGRVRFARACRLLLAIRHTGEFMLLIIALLLRFRPIAELCDKIAGRRRLLQLVLRDYDGQSPHI